MTDQRQSVALDWFIRRGTAADVPFLWQVLSVTYNWIPDRRQWSVEELQQDPSGSRYVEGWGRVGDTAMIAETVAGHRIGAAWFRLFPADEPGYGFVDATTPEIGIGIVAGYRGHGIGRVLLDELLVAARSANFAAVSLSVERNNRPAIALYERLGFRRVGENGGSWTMLRSLR